MTRFARLAAAPAILAALSLTVAPAMATELPASSSRSAIAAELAWDAAAGQTYEQYRTYRHDRRYDRHYDRRHGRNRVDAGDILTGVLILGGIAAVASAATRGNERDRRYPDNRYPDARYPDNRYPAQNSTYRSADVGGIDRAVSMCVESIERDTRVESVDSVDRDAAGWRVTGRLYDGAGFSCSIGADGRIDAIDLSSGSTGYGDDRYGVRSEADIYAAPRGDDRQYDDERYRAAWANVDAQPALPAPVDEPLPPYPGGPLPGDLEEDEIGTGYRGD